MLPPRAPVFLARDTYRRRRLIDALRLLPVIGLLLFLSPLVGGARYLRSTAESGVFIFAVWFGLIVVAWGLGRLLARAPGGGDPLDPDTPPPEPGEAEIPAQKPAQNPAQNLAETPPVPPAT